MTCTNCTPLAFQPFEVARYERGSTRELRNFLLARGARHIRRVEKRYPTAQDALALALPAFLAARVRLHAALAKIGGAA